MKCLPYQTLTLSKYKRVRPVCINLFPLNTSAKSTNSHLLFRFGQSNTFQADGSVTMLHKGTKLGTPQLTSCSQNCSTVSEVTAMNEN